MECAGLVARFGPRGRKRRKAERDEEEPEPEATRRIVGNGNIEPGASSSDGPGPSSRASTALVSAYASRATWTMGTMVTGVVHILDVGAS